MKDDWDKETQLQMNMPENAGLLAAVGQRLCRRAAENPRYQCSMPADGRLQAKAEVKKPVSSSAGYLIVRIRQANLNPALHLIWYFWILRMLATLI